MLAWLGDSVTTDHISPAGSISAVGPAGRWLLAQGVSKEEFNSYGSRRGNHEVMIRGTFANIRIRNRLVPEVEGGFTRHLPSGEKLYIAEAAERYAAEGVPRWCWPARSTARAARGTGQPRARSSWGCGP